jgi:hypothetical protein
VQPFPSFIPDRRRRVKASDGRVNPPLFRHLSVIERGIKTYRGAAEKNAFRGRSIAQYWRGLSGDRPQNPQPKTQDLVFDSVLASSS